MKGGYNGIPSDLEAQYKESVAKNGLYTIRVSSNPYSPSDSYVMGSVPICELFTYGFREEIMLHFNSDNSRVVGMEYTATRTPMSRSCDASKVQKKL